MPTTSPSTQPDLHPWNDGFHWEPHTGPFQVLSVAHVAHFDQDGFVVVPDVFCAEEVAEAVAEIDVAEAAVEAFLRGVDGERLSIAEAGAITFAPHLVARSPRWGQAVSSSSPASHRTSPARTRATPCARPTSSSTPQPVR